MSKIHPQVTLISSLSASPAASSSPSSNSTDPSAATTTAVNNDKQQKVFTVWMKSLMLGGKGCTVFDSDGQVIFRVDNYNGKSSTTYRVHLMDSKGEVICTLLRKKFRLSAKWEAYKTDTVDMSSSSSSSTTITNHLAMERRRPWFCVRKSPLWTWCSVSNLKKPRSFEVIQLGSDRNQQRTPTPLFRIEAQKHCAEHACCRIVDRLGYSVAEVKRKEAVGGVVLGADVLTMTMNQNMDQSLVTALLLCYYTLIPSSYSSSIM